jgi:hypothetical protein
VWSGAGSQTGNTDSSGIFAQRFDASGARIGGEVLVNTVTAGDQTNPSISMAPNGNFVVVWSSFSTASGWDVRGRKFTYNSSGEIVGANLGGSTTSTAEFNVTTSTGNQRGASVAIADNGAFVVSWRNEANNTLVRRRYSATGSVGGNLTVATSATAMNLSTASAADGRSVSAWYDNGQIRAARYTSTGTASGTAFTVASTNVLVSNDHVPSVAMDASGRFVVLWRSSNGNQMLFQRYSDTGVAQGTATAVAADAGVAAKSPSLAINAGGDFAVSWVDDAGEQPVRFKKFAADGTALSTSVFVMNDPDYPGSKSTSVALDSTGRLVAVWSGQGKEDTSGVFARLYQDSNINVPSVTSVVPTAGCTVGATSVVITGTGFQGATSVRFGTVAATSFTVDSPTQITATAPVGAGVVDVRVTTVYGTSENTAADDYSYSPQAIDAVTVGSQSTAVTYGTAASVSFAVTASRSTDCSIVNASYSISGLPAGVTASLSPTSGISASSTAAIPGTTATLSVPATMAAGSYNFTVTLTNGTEVVSGTGTLVVSAKGLTITAGDANKTYGDTVSAGSLTYTTSGLVNGDTVASVSVTSAGAAATAAAGTHPIVVSGASGTGLSNYSITYVSGTLTVNQRALTLTANNQSKTYGTAVPAASTSFTTSGLVNGDTISGVTLVGSGLAANAAVGSYTLTPSAATGTAAANYAISYVAGTMVVSAKALSITASNQSKTYGTNGISQTAFTVSGLVSGDAVANVTLSSTGAGSTAAAGTYTITAGDASGTGLSNYNITYANGSLTVNRKALTVTANNQSKVYGTAIQSGSNQFTTAGLVNSDTVTAVTLTSTGLAATATVGSYTLTPGSAAGSGLSNYTISYTAGSLSVTPKALTVTALNRSKLVGETVTFGGTEFAASGLVNGNTVTSATITSAGAAATATAGTYSIDISSAVGTGLSNYTIAYSSGTLTVNASAPLPTLVNTTTSGTQQLNFQTPRTVAFDSSGNYVVVWSGAGTQTGQDDTQGIFAQRYDSAGNKIGGEVRINTTTAGDQIEPTIAMQGNGNFVVAWSSQNATSGWDIRARRMTLDTSGNIIGFKISDTNTSTNDFAVVSATGDQRAASVSISGTGVFTVAWQAGNTIQRRRYTAAGVASSIGPVTATGSVARNASTATTADGRSVIVWYDSGVIKGRRFLSGGGAAATEFVVASTDVFVSNDNIPSVAIDSNGNFTVLWRSNNGNQLKFQRYNASGVAQGSATNVMADGGFEVKCASLGMNASGEFAITWTENTANRAVKMKRFNASGVELAAATILNDSSYATDKATSVALDSNGNLVVVISGAGPGDDAGVFTRLNP